MIDADALIKTLRELKQSPWYNNNLNPFWRSDAKECMEVIEYFIGKEPTVDAIPVEWIKEWVEEIKDHPAYTEEEKTLCIEEFEDMLGAWAERKEE